MCYRPPISKQSNGGRWVKGQSGNPGGRPKMPEDLKRAMQGLAENAIKVLREAMESDDLRARIMAASHVLDRGYGKPTQAVDLTAKTDTSGAHLEALKALMKGRRGDEVAAVASASVEEDEAPTTH